MLGSCVQVYMCEGPKERRERKKKKGGKPPQYSSPAQHTARQKAPADRNGQPPHPPSQKLAEQTLEK
jgi:hypothetical protein